MQLGKDFKKVLRQIEEEKGLSEETIVSSLEAAMVSAYKKFKGGNQHTEVYIDVENGEFSLYEVYEIVEEVVNPDAEMTLEEAERRGYKELEVGDIIRTEVLPEDFGRIAAQTARQVIIQKLKDAERQVVYEQFSDKIGNIVTGSIFKAEGDQILVRLNDKTEAIMPKEERILGEKYIPGSRMKFYLLDVRQTTRGPRIIVSRTHPGLLRRLLELEVPEIQDGVVEIRNIVREAGTRAKIAVASLDVNVEPLGACVGKQGGRIKSISSELNGERIDIIVFNNDPLKYIVNALSPAKVVRIEPLLDQDRSVIAYVRSDQLSLAIGKAGQNVRLAARLTGWKIDIKVKEEEKLPTMKDLFMDLSEIIDEDNKEERPMDKQSSQPVLKKQRPRTCVGCGRVPEAYPAALSGRLMARCAMIQRERPMAAVRMSAPGVPGRVREEEKILFAGAEGRVPEALYAELLEKCGEEEAG